MIRNLTLLLFTLVSITGFAQNNHKHIKLKEEIKGKRYELFIENTDSIPYDVFLKVDTNDFRRSSDRPILENILGKSKKCVLTKDKLNNT